MFTMRGYVRDMKKLDHIGEVTAISIADRRGIKKKNVDRAKLKENYGIVGDAYAGD